VFLASNFLVPNATFVVELIAFLIVLGVLGRYVLPTLNGVMEARQQTIRQSLEDAETAKRKAQEAETERESTLEKAREQARAIVDEARRAAEAAKAARREEAEQEYQRIVARAEPDIEASARRASEDIRRNVADLVVAVVQKVIADGFDTDAHRQLIDRTIGEVEAGPAATHEVNA
jgi:F-type H+-transporting ATPase subunit b